MKIKQMAIMSTVFTVGRFLVGMGFLHPEKTVQYNIGFALLSGALFTALMALFYRFYKPGNADGKKEAV